MKMKIKTFLFFIFLFLTSNLSAETINMHKIMMIESSGNALSHNVREDSRGLLSIRRCVLTDYNQATRHHYKMDDLFDAQINTSVARWYLLVELPRLLKHYNKPATVQNIIISYNGGIKYVARDLQIPKSTKQYLRRYWK